MNSTHLHRLRRAEIQAIAKREGLRANAKTHDIISEINHKYPGGVPSYSLTVPSGSTTRVSIVVDGFIKQETGNETQTQGDDDRVAEQPPPDAEANRQTNVDVHPLDSEVAHAAGGPSSSIPDVQRTTSAGPSYKEIRLALKDMTGLVDAGPEIRRKIQEAQILLEKTRAIVKTMRSEINELIWTRHFLEERVIKMMKDDSALWDGTQLLKEKDRRRWLDYSKEKNEKYGTKRSEKEAQHGENDPGYESPNLRSQLRKRTNQNAPDTDAPRKRVRT